MWVDYRGSLSTVYNDGEISTCGEITEVHPVQSTMMGTTHRQTSLKSVLSMKMTLSKGILWNPLL